MEGSHSLFLNLPYDHGGGNSKKMKKTTIQSHFFGKRKPWQALQNKNTYFSHIGLCNIAAQMTQNAFQTE